MNDWRARLNTEVAVLLGGSSAEREVSLKSGRAVLDALQRQGVACRAFDTGDRGWLSALSNSGIRYAFIALHGPVGEDGAVQGALDCLGIHYSSSGVMASALAMDKLRCKQLWRGVGLPTPDFAVLDDASDWQALMQCWGEVIVKPACEGSSVGMARVASAQALEVAYREARRFAGAVIAEQWITGREYTVGVLGHRALPAIRLETDHAFYDYEAKYHSNTTRYICPSELPSEQEAELQALALTAFDSLGCRGWGRVDFMQDKNGEFLLLEVNTIPGMTDHSLVPMAAKAAGMDFDQLVLEILRQCVEPTA